MERRRQRSSAGRLGDLIPTEERDHGILWKGYVLYVGTKIQE